ncbi:MAG: aminoacyl-tRNA hydrolase [Bacteroidales bacterium]|nr:aminoacyl-tRNA hydrolase [Bacteroidales bacterium]
MTTDELKARGFEKELKFSFSPSSGPGGQNVNKVNTRVELRFDVRESTIISEEEKQVILKKLAGRITKEEELILSSQSERSQFRNKEKVTEKFFEIITRSLTPAKKRKPTSPSKASKERRLESKRINAERKLNRRKTDI